MADFKKGSNEFNLSTEAGGQLALKHRKIIRAGLINILGARNTYVIKDEDTDSKLVILDPSDINEYVTASIYLRAPAIIECFVESGILTSTSQSSTIPEYLNTSNVEFISDSNWNIKFSYGGKNFVISPGNTVMKEITCESLSLYRHTIRLYSAGTTNFNIYFDIINNYRKPYTTLSEVKSAIKSLCDNNNLTIMNFPCGGYYCKIGSDSSSYPYGNPNGFVTHISYTNNSSYLNCIVCSLYKNLDGYYEQYNSTQRISSSSVSDYVLLLA